MNEDLDYIIARGNHELVKSDENEVTLLKNYKKEVERGWMLPVTLANVKKIKGSGIIPVGVANQFTIDKKVNRNAKQCTTHDASYPLPSEN